MTERPRPALPRIAFHAPMKAPDHPNPSGDRHIARLILQALARAGFDATCVSRLRVLDLTGDPAAQTRLRAEAGAEAAHLRLTENFGMEAGIETVDTRLRAALAQA